MPHIYTIGHSNQTVEEFVARLHPFAIEALADIRRFPGSRRHPWFSKDSLAGRVRAAGLEYHWFQDLGGFRGRSNPESRNTGLRHPAFRNYADHMQSPAFEAAARALMDVAEKRRTAYMCAELLYWHCHRMLLSDFFASRGWQVTHILGDGNAREHQLTDAAKIENGRLVYPPVEGELF